MNAQKVCPRGVAVLTVAVIAAMLSSLAAFAQPTPVAPSLYQRLGGLAPITVVVDDFINRLVVDNTLNANPRIKEARDRVPAPYLKYHVSALVCQVTGGPCSYTGRSMKESHAHLAITESEWDEMVRVFRAVLTDHKVPAKEQEELLAVVGSTKPDIVMAAKPAM